MDRTVRAFATAALISACAFLSSATAMAVETKTGVPEVGSAVLVTKRVAGKLGQRERLLEAGFRVYRSELLQSGPEAQAELRLDDNTKLALGPNAELRLDEYVVASGGSAKSIALKFLKGSFRFLTGSTLKEGYKIDTPVATIGVRGTIFDLYIAANGETFVLLHEGELNICSSSAPGSLAGRCERLIGPGQILYAGCDGVVSVPGKWNRALMPGVSAAVAFPFVGRSLGVDPVARLSHAAITDEAASGRTVRRGVCPERRRQ